MSENMNQKPQDIDILLRAYDSLSDGEKRALKEDEDIFDIDAREAGERE